MLSGILILLFFYIVAPIFIIVFIVKAVKAHNTKVAEKKYAPNQLIRQEIEYRFSRFLLEVQNANRNPSKKTVHAEISTTLYRNSSLGGTRFTEGQKYKALTAKERETISKYLMKEVYKKANDYFRQNPIPSDFQASVTYGERYSGSWEADDPPLCMVEYTAKNLNYQDPPSYI